MMISINYQFNALHVCGVRLWILGWGSFFIHMKEEHYHLSSRLSNLTLTHLAGACVQVVAIR